MECLDFFKDLNFVLFFKHASNWISAMLWFTIVMPPFVTVSTWKIFARKSVKYYSTFGLFGAHYGLDVFYQNHYFPSIKMFASAVTVGIENFP